MSQGPGAEKTANDGLETLQRRLGHIFKDPALFGRALTHTSVDAGGPSASYERLEFLGDRVLGLVVAEMLLKAFPEAAEGELAPRFNALVRRETVAEVARNVGVGPHLRLGAGEQQTGGRNKLAILADVGESLIAAIYLDDGLEAAAGFIHRQWGPILDRQIEPPRDAKTILQEWSQARGLGLPEYRETGRTGPDHAPVFTLDVQVSGHAPATGSGSSKRDAEQAAAGALLAREQASADIEPDGPKDG